LFAKASFFLRVSAKDLSFPSPAAAAAARPGNFIQRRTDWPAEFHAEHWSFASPHHV